MAQDKRYYRKLNIIDLSALAIISTNLVQSMEENIGDVAKFAHRHDKPTLI